MTSCEGDVEVERVALIVGREEFVDDALVLVRAFREEPKVNPEGVCDVREGEHEWDWRLCVREGEVQLEDSESASE